jgi:hypothetical protein
MQLLGSAKNQMIYLLKIKCYREALIGSPRKIIECFIRYELDMSKVLRQCWAVSTRSSYNSKGAETLLMGLVENTNILEFFSNRATILCKIHIFHQAGVNSHFFHQTESS